jgi:hypothetical protein
MLLKGTQNEAQFLNVYTVYSYYPQPPCRPCAAGAAMAILYGKVKDLGEFSSI